MNHLERFYIDGTWVTPSSDRMHPVIDPTSERQIALLPLGAQADVDHAVAAATRAFEGYRQTSRQERLQLLRTLLDLYNQEYEQLAQLMTQEMGTTLRFSRDTQALMGRIHIEAGIAALEEFRFDTLRGDKLICKEPIGVCGLITPWNWPVHQLMLKIVPALATGCTLVIKPSEYASLSAVLITELIDQAGFPAGVYNYVQGLGEEVGVAISRHPDVHMISFTGSTRAGISVAREAAPSIKRVAQELGGKCPNILLPDADFETMVADGVSRCFVNCGQACASPSRMLVPHHRMDEVAQLAGECANAFKVAPPRESDSDLGPVVNRKQFDNIQRWIQMGIDEGAVLVAGGIGRPAGLNIGYYVRPTVFSHVSNDMEIARTELFGPVLSLIGYHDEDEALHIANDSPYGLAAYVQSRDREHARRLARRLRAGTVFINEAQYDPTAPFGGYKQSGNGREGGEFGFEEYLEIKTIAGYAP